MRQALPEEEWSPYDSHPPIAERIARIQQLPDDGRALTGARPALSLLADPAHAFAALEQTALTPEAHQLRRTADWTQLVNESMLWHAVQDAEPLRTAATEIHGGDGSLASCLDAPDAGRLWQMADRLPKSPQAQAATGRAAREFARPQVRARRAWSSPNSSAAAGPTGSCPGRTRHGRAYRTVTRRRYCHHGRRTH
ncbi:hypothetical protein ACFZAV_02700 [Streptomyces sp. NPDC008343]|uniref:hypothetical protein n=1 Tax=Streptomyces sp. NPDC008343 TaxID=3364828 RepID=UPI0036E02DE7